MTPQPPRPSPQTPNGKHAEWDLVEAIAQRTAELVLERLAGVVPLVDAQTVAGALGISPETVRGHADELGVVRVGTGSRPRLRFDLATARAAWNARSVGERSQAAETPKASAPRAKVKARGVELVPIRRQNGGRRAA